MTLDTHCNNRGEENANKKMHSLEPTEEESEVTDYHCPVLIAIDYSRDVCTAIVKRIESSMLSYIKKHSTKKVQ